MIELESFYIHHEEDPIPHWSWVWVESITTMGHLSFHSQARSIYRMYDRSLSSLDLRMYKHLKDIKLESQVDTTDALQWPRAKAPFSHPLFKWYYHAALTISPASMIFFPYTHTAPFSQEMVIPTLISLILLTMSWLYACSIPVCSLNDHGSLGNGHTSLPSTHHSPSFNALYASPRGEYHSWFFPPWAGTRPSLFLSISFLIAAVDGERLFPDSMESLPAAWD